jgi:hypothetical protein
MMKILILILFALATCSFGQNSVPKCIKSYLKKIKISSRRMSWLDLKADGLQDYILTAVDDYKIIDFFLKGLAEDLRSNFTTDEAYNEIFETFKAN